MLILKQQKVSFKDISSEYDYDNLSSKTIKTKLNDGPNLYRTFFEQLIVSFLLNRFSDKISFKKKYNERLIKSTHKLLIQDIQNILSNFENGSKKYSFYIMNFCLHNNQQTILKLKYLKTIL